MHTVENNLRFNLDLLFIYLYYCIFYFNGHVYFVLLALNYFLGVFLFCWMFTSWHRSSGRFWDVLQVIFDPEKKFRKSSDSGAFVDQWPALWSLKIRRRESIHPSISQLGMSEGLSIFASWYLVSGLSDVLSMLIFTTRVVSVAH